jgi:C-terminal binding-module, SLH-like, of glucodextranase
VRGRILVGAAALAAAFVLTAAVAAAAAGGSHLSLYAGPAPRPGPDILYAPPADAPQLENAPGSLWKAPPILISGATAYRDGEFLSQDWLYDDYGAHEAVDPTDPMLSSAAFSMPNGTYTYPTNPEYGNDAADFVELRVKPVPDATAFRVTLNTLNNPSLVAFSIAIGGTPGVTFPFPDGANVRAPAQLFLTVHASAGGAMVGDLVNAADGVAVIGPSPQVSVDRLRRQIQVLIPHADWNPTGQVVRLAAGVGLWNGAAGQYLLPGRTATATQPGGAGVNPLPAAFFNVAFRTNSEEPMPDISGVAGDLADTAWWRDQAQAQALATGDISGFYANVDFSKVASDGDDESGVPTSGAMDRILASHFQTEQGANFADSCSSQAEGCKGEFQGQLQPYAIYVPTHPPPAGGYGMTLLMHALDSNYNLFEGSRNQSEFGQRGDGSIVITPEARGPDGSYTSYAEADVFEAWADAATHYHLNPDVSDVTGYSMGAIGTFKLAEQFPDLFARAFSTSGADSNGGLASLRDLPVLMWSTAADEEVPAPEYLDTATTLLQLGYRYELDVFTPGEHNSFAVLDQYAPAAAFLGDAAVDRNPADVTYAVNPTHDYPALGLVTGHAYWLSGLSPAGPAGSTGTISAFSHGFGTGDPRPSGPQTGSGTLTGTNVLPFVAYARSFQTWGTTPARATADQVDISSTDVASATISVARARVDCSVKLDVTSNVPLKITLAGCPDTPARTFAPKRGCPRATGRLHGRTLGRVTLGMTRAHARRRYTYSKTRETRFKDFFCLTPIGVRVGYASPALLRTLPRRERRHLAGRVVWASTSNAFYAVAGVRPGASLRTAARRLRLTRGFHIGRNDWYLAPNGASTAVLKVRHRVVEEIGIGTRRITHGRRAQRTFLKSFS